MNYYIADCHFSHKNILHFDQRPFENVEQMEEIMCASWNQTVNEEDTVYILGDFCWGKADEWLKITKKLAGKKILVEGNHDLKQYPLELRAAFVDIKPYLEVLIVEMIMSAGKSSYAIIRFLFTSIQDFLSTICYVGMFTTLLKMII